MKLNISNSLFKQKQTLVERVNARITTELSRLPEGKKVKGKRGRRLVLDTPEKKKERRVVMNKRNQEKTAQIYVSADLRDKSVEMIKAFKERDVLVRSSFDFIRGLFVALNYHKGVIHQDKLLQPLEAMLEQPINKFYALREQGMVRLTLLKEEKMVFESTVTALTPQVAKLYPSIDFGAMRVSDAHSALFDMALTAVDEGVITDDVMRYVNQNRRVSLEEYIHIV